jgi:hypothetical protein
MINERGDHKRANCGERRNLSQVCTPAGKLPAAGT